jgi:hypothetical protein
MNKVITAEEFLAKYQKSGNHFCVTKGEAINKLVEFAKLHLEAQKEEIKKVIKETISVYNWEVPFKIIDEAYPLTNIK